MSTSRGITETKIYDRAAVEERYGVPPELITDLMGLRGDTSDNIPGVPGIGEKTATQLLQRFGSLEEVLASVDQISGAKRKQNLTEHADDARMSKQLATLQYDLETGVDLAAAMAIRARPRRPARVHARVRAAGGAGAAGRGAAGGRRRPRPQGRDRDLRSRRSPASPEDLGPGPLALAIDGERWAAAEAGRVLTGASTHDELAVALAGRAVSLAHDAKSLGGGRHGLLAAAAREGVEPNLEHDTMVAAYLLEPQRRTYDLVELAADAGIGLAEGAAAEVASRGRRAAGAGGRAGGRSRSRRGSAARRRPRRRPGTADRAARTGRSCCARSSCRWSSVLAAMEREGLKLDAERLAQVGAGFGERIETLQREIFELAEEEFTIGSPQQVGRILFEKLGSDPQAPRQNRVLDRRPRPRPDPRRARDRREDRELARADQAEEHLPRLAAGADRPRDRPRPHHLQPGLDHHRPPLQHQPEPAEHPHPDRDRPPGPRLLRRRGRGNQLLSADYSQVELRVLAHVADEEVLKEVFHAGEDVHAATAAEVFEIERDEVDVGQRSKAKMVNFGIVYGLTGFGLADRLNIPRKEGEEFVSRYLERFPAVRAFREQIIERAQEEGFVTTLMGRRRQIPELRSGNPNTRRLGERLAVNTVIQGTAADIIKVAMVRCRRALEEAGGSTRLVLQIHDELLFEGPPGEMEAATELVRREMCAAYQLDPPLEVDIGVGADWLDRQVEARSWIGASPSSSPRRRAACRRPRPAEVVVDLREAFGRAS